MCAHVCVCVCKCVCAEYGPLWEGVVRCVIEAGIQEHGQGSQGGDDDKQPQEETVYDQGDELPVSCHLEGTHTHTHTHNTLPVSSESALY